MADYKKMYFHLFNAVTNTLNEVERYNFGLAGQYLKNGQIDCEAIYVESEGIDYAADLYCDPDGEDDE